ncbi:MAG: exoribonuclease-2 [Lentisphaeria bacterium]|jgi:exoribonuclease-2
MLDSSVLSQLSQLKKEIVESKEYGTGTVVGSNGRFGFVKLSDGRDAFLSPDKMQRVIPGDTVKVVLSTNKKNKLEAELEELTSTVLGRFIGQYRIKGKAHFVEPNGAQSSRWVFLPPKNRGKCKEGDFVVAKMIRHPFGDGQAAAKIIERIGQPHENKIEVKYVKAKFNLNRAESEPLQQQAAEIETLFNSDTEDAPLNDSFLSGRTDLTHLSFVTIDSATTKDMDDALAIEFIGEGDSTTTRLHVAIADPGSFIKQDSTLANSSQVRAQTVYLLGGYSPMLPVSLAHFSFSLEANKKRPALVCHIDFDVEGQVLSSEFEFAVIESKHKLTYEDVSSFLDAEADSIPEEIKAQLKSLHLWATTRREYRKQNCITSDDQTDYEYQLDEMGKIVGVQPRPRNVAHRLVEEAMLVTNVSAATLLAKHQTGLCIAHGGFRKDRLGEVKALLKEENISLEQDINELDGHIALFTHLQGDEQRQKLIAPLRRMMQSGELSLSPSPHLGMGSQGYATITSPIRRFADLYNHWAIQHALLGSSFKPLNETALTTLKEEIQVGRQADRELTQWLIIQYTAGLVGSAATGKIRIVTQQGFGVRLEDSGIDGFVLFPKNTPKKYDAKRMTLTIDDVVYFIGKKVDITIQSVDLDKRRIAFELASDKV